MNRFKRNLIISYTLSLALLIISALASYFSISKLVESQEWVNHTNEVIIDLENVISVLKDAETGQRGFLLTGKDQFLDSYHGAYEKSISIIDQVQKLTNDNAAQQVSIGVLRSLVTKRFNTLSALIETKKKGGTINDSLLMMGKGYMDDSRSTVQTMEDREKVLLGSRNANLERFTKSTPVLIIVASVLSVIITIVSFLRVTRDFNKRVTLQKVLEQKDEDISKRLTIIQRIAAQISSGDYQLKVDDNESDSLGSIAISLNKMSESLDYSFTNLKHREWLQTGIAELNEIMIGEKEVLSLAYKVIEFVTAYTRSQTGAFYLSEDSSSLALSASIALDKSKIKSQIQIGEGIAGQTALTRQVRLLENMDDSELLVNFTGGNVRPKAIIAVPVTYETKLKGVLEIASLNGYDQITLDFLNAASFNIGMAIHSARDHQRLQELLAETQSQSEELQSQHNELENINAELEAQAEKLQTSEEELRVQQEELHQSNQELEERSRLLEEKNELILERNLDIQRKAEELELSTKYKSEFLANMSHELRTPLNSILLLSRLLSENPGKNLTADQIEYADVIQGSGKGLLTLIDEILDLSKIESGKMNLEYGDTNLKGITDDLRALFVPIARDKGINFITTISQDVPVLVMTDKLRVEQVLRNLLSNALKFTKHGTVSLTITKTAANISFAVKDTGIGIAKEKQSTIFEAFQQADGSTRRQYGGTGLGLSISRELAKLLGGEIIVSSEEGAGSEFTFFIPIDKPEEKAAPEPVAFFNESVISKPAVHQSDPSKTDSSYLVSTIPEPVPDDRQSIQSKDKVILIIEDDRAFATALLTYTKTNGYKGLVAVRGDEGVELARKFLPVGILLDLQLPVKNGWEVMHELKSDPLTRSIPVHMMSSHEVRTKSLSTGAVDFINKPVAFERLGEMFQKIEEALTRSPKKVLIVEENAKHAQALAYFLGSFSVSSEIKTSVAEGIESLQRSDVDCVILDMGVPAQRSYETLDAVKKTPGFENLPIIIFTGRNLSNMEEMKIKQYADTIVVKTAHSYQRILEEVSLFLHLVEENKKDDKTSRYKKMGELGEVLNGKNILIADDDIRNIFSLSKSLELYGVNVLSATDGREALRQLQANPKVDLVLMDMMMPEMDGYESTRKIREIPEFRRLPVIAVTAKAMTGDREKCISAGASDYITKPVDIDQLTSLLRVWLYNY